MILMLSPSPRQSFVCSSGNTYVSDSIGLIKITNGSTADQSDLTALGCTTLVPMGQGSLVTAGLGNVDAVTTAALPACTYANGTAGVGATLTGNSNAALAAQDGVTLTANQRLLVRRQVDMTQHGPYKLTQVGDGSHPFILTRATDADSSDELTYILVTAGGGSTLNGRRFMCPLLSAAIILGTTKLPFVAAD